MNISELHQPSLITTIPRHISLSSSCCTLFGSLLACEYPNLSTIIQTVSCVRTKSLRILQVNMEGRELLTQSSNFKWKMASNEYVPSKRNSFYNSIIQNYKCRFEGQ